jgi:hypothetical protein
LRCAIATGKLKRKGCGLFLQDGAILPGLRSPSGLRRSFLAAKDNALKQEDVILPINIGLGHHKEIVEEEITKVCKMMTLPVVDSRRQALDRLLVLGAPLCLVDLVGDTLCSIGSAFQLIVMSICRCRACLEKRLCNDAYQCRQR